MSEAQMPIPDGIPISLKNLQIMAEHAQKTFEVCWEDLLLEPKLCEQLLVEPRREADRLMGRWLCRVNALESYVLGEEPDEIYGIDELGSQFVGSYETVDIHPIQPIPKLPFYGEATGAMCLIFRPAGVDVFTDEGVATLYDSVAVPLLPRLDTSNVDVVKIWPQGS